MVYPVLGRPGDNLRFSASSQVVENLPILSLLLGTAQDTPYVFILVEPVVRLFASDLSVGWTDLKQCPAA